MRVILAAAIAVLALFWLIVPEEGPAEEDGLEPWAREGSDLEAGIGSDAESGLPEAEISPSNVSTELPESDDYYEVTTGETVLELIARLPERLRVAAIKIYENESPHRNMFVRGAKGSPKLFTEGFDALKELDGLEAQALFHLLLSGRFETREERRLQIAIIWRLDLDDPNYRSYLADVLMQAQADGKSLNLIAHVVHRQPSMPDVPDLWAQAEKSESRMLLYALAPHAGDDRIPLYLKSPDLLSGVVKSFEPAQAPDRIRRMVERKQLKASQAVKYLEHFASFSKSKSGIEAVMRMLATLTEEDVCSVMNSVREWAGPYVMTMSGRGWSGPDSILGSGPADTVMNSLADLGQLGTYRIRDSEHEATVLRGLKTVQDRHDKIEVHRRIHEVISHWYLTDGEESHCTIEEPPRYDKTKHYLYSDPEFASGNGVRIALVRDLADGAHLSLRESYGMIIRHME